MNCSEALVLLDDHIDGLLAPPLDRVVRDHLQRCPGCRDEAAAVQEVIAAARRLPDSIEPGRDLWSAIELRLERPAGRGRRSSAALATIGAVAATLLIAIAGGAYLLRPTGPAGGRDPVAGPPAVHLPAASLAGAETPIDEAQRAFDTARQELLVALEPKRASLSAETLEMVDTNLRIVEDAVAEIRHALAKDPANLELNRMLVSYRHRELDLLQRVTRHATRL